MIQSPAGACQLNCPFAPSFEVRSTMDFRWTVAADLSPASAADKIAAPLLPDFASMFSMVALGDSSISASGIGFRAVLNCTRQNGAAVEFTPNENTRVAGLFR